ncbi:Catalase [Gracilariopsis chorda]|uniref:catalase n=1 Tax=Gracilariopsis chorda TaxID=448386 RepID=A0A2V3IID1_9FLOR|nr:Catalase [Gracilariopsis chorda]|eukprot:PXF41846.1 Catalase [Gracilariopsis chorda]
MTVSVHLVLLNAALFFLLLPHARTSSLTGETGRYAGSNQHSQSVSRTGPLLLQDVYALEKLRRFNHERIPERVVHARGAGAHGYFVGYKSLQSLTTASLFRAGKRTPVFVRFSTVVHGKGSPETVRDPRGFAIKFKTEEGNWDLVGNNLPVFFIRDHIKFPDMVHSLKPDPVTNRQDPNRFFDFFSALGGMATNMLTFVYSDLGIPAAYRFMDGNSVHAFKFVNAQKNVTYVKFRWFTNQGVRNLTRAQAQQIQAKDFSHATQDLYQSIRKKDFPSWELAVQTMKPEQLDSFDFDPLDATKEWPVDQFPFTTVGRIVLDKVPSNFHLFSEQSAFDPGNVLSGGIEPSEDRLLQGRLISYHESQTHRLGSNSFTLLPVNKPISPVRTYNQDGVMTYEHAWEGSINYEPNNSPDSYREVKGYMYSSRQICGAYMQASIEKTLNFKQAGETYRRFSVSDRANLVDNLAADLMQVRSMGIKNTMCAHFYKADRQYGSTLAEKVGCDQKMMTEIASSLDD